MTGDDLLLWTALSIGLIHTLLGPDHYLPFVAMRRARGWSTPRMVAAVCGFGAAHVTASAALGLIGIAFGVALGWLEGLQHLRGEVAAWLLLGAGLAYASWGIRRARQGGSHTHAHVHADGTVHAHPHTHTAATHRHPHASEGRWGPWLVFLVFLLGPCEALIPVLMYPAAQSDWHTVGTVTLAFGAATLSTMVVATLVADRLLGGLLERAVRGRQDWSHALAGGTIALCGAGILVLGH
ncbi:MAG: sulfite exporter TauE/SafE family protein [Steroidobacteraceae bacterium]